MIIYFLINKYMAYVSFNRIPSRIGKEVQKK